MGSEKRTVVVAHVIAGAERADGGVAVVPSAAGSNCVRSSIHGFHSSPIRYSPCTHGRGVCRCEGSLVGDILGEAGGLGWGEKIGEELAVHGVFIQLEDNISYLQIVLFLWNDLWLNDEAFFFFFLLLFLLELFLPVVYK